jgi:uncharacterized protein YebE (UPF0316 family)
MSSVPLMCGIIILARIGDVSLGTIRAIMTIQGRRLLAMTIGIFELLIWLFVVSQVIQDLRTQPIYGVAYALGFSLGTFVGMTIEQKLALGRQVVRVITRQGVRLAQALRDVGYMVTVFDGHGRDGPVQELFIEVERRQAPKVIAEALELDPQCYYIVDDVRHTSSATLRQRATVGWRGMLKKK